ncbi:hypothetical protein [Caloramator australicus]|uniref:Uncharacterized protein n=1 Tax=Caloramator australicus RC3 TaxID=857293 RepID=I7KUP5_9CLOT|nr:hypothetical protein [Caloramator australicus]CCJ33658.1 hypothetical protein clustered with lysine fermentation genes [Caloramator australicus RC3]
MSNVLKLIKPYRTISIIGMEKNVGKTTVLNHILNKARGSYPLGLTSIGRDGEDIDRVTNTEKPRIYIEKGTIFATCKEFFLKSDVTKEVLETTGINTPLGEIIIGRALSDGYIEIAGPSVNSAIRWTSERMLHYGAGKVLIDGALSRKTMASPSITQATILSTGAALSRDINKVIDKTELTLKLLSIKKEEDDKVLNSAFKILENFKIGVIYNDYSFKSINVLTSLEASKDIVENLMDDVTHVVIKGVVTDKILEDIIKSTDRYKGKTFLVEDGTKLFLNREILDVFIKSGGEIRALMPINVICITINPKSPYGYEFDAKRFQEKMKEKINIPVFNVLGDE